MGAVLTSNGNIGRRLRRNVTIGDRRTSVSLEDHVWAGLLEVCRREAVGIDRLCSMVDSHRARSSMSSSLRVFLLLYFRGMAETLERAQASGDSSDGRIFGAALEMLRAGAERRPAATS